MKYEVPAGAKIMWVGRLDAVDFRGWSVSQNGCTNIELVDGEKFKIHFITGDITEIPVANTGFSYGLMTRNEKRVSRKSGDKK